MAAKGLRLEQKVKTGLKPTQKLSPKQLQALAIHYTYFLRNSLRVHQMNLRMEDAASQAWRDEDEPALDGEPELGDSGNHEEEEGWDAEYEELEEALDPTEDAWWIAMPQCEEAEFVLSMTPECIEIQLADAALEEYLYGLREVLRIFIRAALRGLEDALNERRALLEKRLRDQARKRLELLTISELSRQMASEECANVDINTLRNLLSYFLNRNKILLPDGRVTSLAYFFASEEGGRPRAEIVDQAILEIAQSMVKDNASSAHYADIARAVQQSERPELQDLKVQKQNTILKRVSRVLRRYWTEELEQALQSRKPKDAFERFLQDQLGRGRKDRAKSKRDAVKRKAW